MGILIQWQRIRASKAPWGCVWQCCFQPCRPQRWIKTLADARVCTAPVIHGKSASDETTAAPPDLRCSRTGHRTLEWRLNLERAGKGQEMPVILGHRIINVADVILLFLLDVWFIRRLIIPSDCSRTFVFTRKNVDLRHGSKDLQDQIFMVFFTIRIIFFMFFFFLFCFFCPIADKILEFKNAHFSDVAASYRSNCSLASNDFPPTAPSDWLRVRLSTANKRESAKTQQHTNADKWK